jgi:integrase
VQIRNRGVQIGNPLFKYIEKGKGTAKVIGKNSLGKFPQFVAKFLELPDYELFSGHCFRRTAATLMADAGTDKITLKRAGRWKSDQVVDGYIAQSTSSKLKIANALASAVMQNDSNDNPSSSKNDDCGNDFKGNSHQNNVINISNVTGNVYFSI